MRVQVPVARGERGTALVMALLVLLALSLISAVLMVALSSEFKIAGSYLRVADSLNLAESGVNEAVAHIRSGNIENTGANPRMVAQIFNTTAGNPGRRVRICVPHSAQNSRVTARSRSLRVNCLGAPWV